MAYVGKLNLIRSVCRSSFYDFVQRFWHVTIPRNPIWNWHIKYLCDELQAVAERVFADRPKQYDLIINISPGETKSTICTVMFPCWAWTRMDTAQFICGSYENSLALGLSLQARDILKSDLYRECFPEIILRDDQHVKSNYYNTRGGKRKSTSTGAGITGFHAHFIIVDDPLDPRKAASDLEIETANRWISETLSSRKVDKSVTPTILIMQRLHQNDPTMHLLNTSRSARHICLPAEITDDIKPTHLQQYYVDGLMNPYKTGWNVLEEAKLQGEYTYSSQYLQNPIPRGGGMFKVDLLNFVDQHDLPKKYNQEIRFWDKAGTEGDGAFTVGTKIAASYHNGQMRFWILDVVRGQWSSDKREATIRAVAEMDGIKCLVGIEQEPGSGGKESAENTMRNLAGFHVRVDKPTGSKVERADPFSVQVNAGNVYMLRAPWNQIWVNEMMFWPNSRYKDQGDSAAGAFNMLKKAGRRVGAFRGTSISVAG